MGIVRCKSVVNCDAATAYGFIRGYGVLTEFVPNAEMCELLSESEGGSVQKLRWLGKANLFGMNMYIRWTEETRYDDAARTLTFRQLDGDYKKYEGTWTFEPQDGKTMMRFTLDFKIAHPLMSLPIDMLIDKMMRKNAEEMLENIRKRIESGNGKKK